MLHSEDSASLYSENIENYLFPGNKKQVVKESDNLPPLSLQKSQQIVSNGVSSYDSCTGVFYYKYELENLFDLQQYINSDQSSGNVQQEQYNPVSSSSSVKNSRSKKSKKKPSTASDKIFWKAFLQNKNMSTVLSQHSGPLPRTHKGSLARSKAAQEGDLKLLNMLLAYEASGTNKPLSELVRERSGKDGGTPLHFAVCGIANDVTTYDHEHVRRYKNIIDYLIQNGAEIDAFDGQGFTPLQLLILHNAPKAIMYKFIDYGASLDKKSKNKKYLGWSALHFAAYNGKIKVLKKVFVAHKIFVDNKILIANKSIVNAPAENGDTPLDALSKKIAQLQKHNATGKQLRKAEHKAKLLGYAGGITQSHK